MGCPEPGTRDEEVRSRRVKRAQDRPALRPNGETATPRARETNPPPEEYLCRNRISAEVVGHLANSASWRETARSLVRLTCMGKKKASRPVVHQHVLGFIRKARPGNTLGCKPSPDSGVSHQKRPKVQLRIPMLVSIKLLEGLPTTREGHAVNVVARSMAGLRSSSSRFRA